MIGLVDDDDDKTCDDDDDDGTSVDSSIGMFTGDSVVVVGKSFVGRLVGVRSDGDDGEGVVVGGFVETVVALFSVVLLFVFWLSSSFPLLFSVADGAGGDGAGDGCCAANKHDVRL